MVHELRWDGKQRDKKMLQQFLPVLDSADEVVAQNGDQFDIKVIRTRCLLNDIPMAPKYTTVDTLKQMKSQFRLASNRLDYAGEKLLGKGKRAAGQKLWEDIIERNDPKAMRKMILYCKTDVRILEGVADRIRPYCVPKTSIAEYPRDCPECGGLCYKRGGYTSVSGVFSVNLVCTECGVKHTVGGRKYAKNKKFATA